MERRLAAILAADVVGYTRLMGVDETGTLRRLTELRQQVLEPLIAEHRGRIVKLTGDGLLIEFASIVDAVTCAVGWQNSVAEWDATADEGERFNFRIGINLGDVIVEGDDIHGDGVNIAARLEGQAEPGGICLSSDAYRQVKGKVDFDFEDLGEQDLKNVAEPVRIYRIASGRSGTGAASPVRQSLALPDKPSIAVLPFDNMSTDPDQEYFADGITEDIITALSKFRWFFVIARNSTFVYKGQSVGAKQVGRELGVRYVLEGSVRKAANRVRISAQLIEAESGNHVWAERYDRSLNDIFELQDEMTATIVGAVEPELGDAERLRAIRKPPENLDAWDRCQRGFWHYWRRERDDAEEAERLFLGAIELDPSFSSAYAGLSEVCYIKLYSGWTDAPEETLSRGLQAGQQAVSLDDKDAFAHFALGRVHLLQGQYEIAIVELEKALDLNPNLAIAYYGLGKTLLWSGRAQEALTSVRKAIRQSPNDPLLFGFEEIAGAAHYQLGEYNEAAEWCRKATRHPTSSFWTNTHLATAVIELDRLDEANAAIKEAQRKQPDLSVTGVSVMLGRMHSVYRGRILDALRRAGLPE